MEFEPQPEFENTNINNETLNCSTQNSANPSNDDLQNQIESSAVAYDPINMNPNIHLEDTVLTCTLCLQNSTNFSCTGLRDMVKHLWEMHKEKLYVCNFCNEQFYYEFELLKHKKNRKPPNNLNKNWQCTPSPKIIFGSKYSLEEHNIRPYPCYLCGKSYASEHTYKVHRKTHEPRIRRFVCEICKRAFLTKQNLTNHEKIHKETKDFFCSLCDNRKFTTENNLQSHMVIHEKNKRFPCPFVIDGEVCGKIFARAIELRNHERIHTGERPHVCMTCGMTFTQHSNMKSHIKATHLNLKTKICNICGKGFNRKRLLRYHMNSVHTKERPYKCTQCEKDFVYPNNFKKHIIDFHENEKPFQCNICDKILDSRDKYNSHLFTHTTRKQFECSICKVGFKLKQTLKKHMDNLKHGGSTYVFNRAQMQLSSDGNTNAEENSWEVIVVSETKEIDEVALRKAQFKIKNFEYPYENVQNPDGSQYVGTIENGEVLLDGNNNGIIDGMNMYSGQHTLQQIEIQTDDGVKYILVDFGPNQ